jgi:hypothetical protein
MTDPTAAMTARQLDDAGRVHLNREGFRQREQVKLVLANVDRGIEGARSLKGVFQRASDDLAGLFGTHPEVRAVHGAASTAASTADVAAANIRATLTDDRIAPEARQRLANEQLAEARATISGLVTKAATNVALLRAKLTIEAIGTVARDREGFARADAEASMAAAPDPVTGMTRLAQDADPNVRALAAGDWGQRRLEAANVTHLDDHLAAIRKVAVETAKVHGTERAKKAAETLDRLSSAVTLSTYGSHYGALALSGFDDVNAGR